MRELTKNEKSLLSILGIILIGWGTYQFVITPQLRKLESFNAQKLEYQEKIDEIESIFKKEDAINKDLDALRGERDESVSQYFPKVDQAQVTYLLNDLLEKDDINILDMNFERSSYEDFGEVQVKNMGISIAYEGTYNAVIDVIKSLKNSPRKILVESVSMDRDDDGDVEGNIFLKIYGLDHMVSEEGEVIAIRAPKRNFTSTPFLAYRSYEEKHSSKAKAESSSSPSSLDSSNYSMGTGSVPNELEVPQGLNPYSPGFSVDYEKENEISFTPGQEFK